MVIEGEQDARRARIIKHKNILFIGVVFGLKIVVPKYNACPVHLY